MKARLSRVIESLGYKPSRTARNLSLGLKGCIGVVVDSIQDPWFTQLLTGMEEELQSRDASLMLLSLELRDTYDPAIAFEWIEERRVDGLIIAKCHRRDKALMKAAIDAHVPIVAVAPDEARTDLTVRGPTTSRRGARWERISRSSVTPGSHSPAAPARRSNPVIAFRACARSSGHAASGCAKRTLLSRQLRGRGRRRVRADVPAPADAANGRRPRRRCSGDWLHAGGAAARRPVPGDSAVAGSTAFPKARGRGRADDDGPADAGDGTRCLPSSVHAMTGGHGGGRPCRYSMTLVVRESTGAPRPNAGPRHGEKPPRFDNTVRSGW